MTAPTSISVVIALYNKAQFITATLASALAQRMPALEIIVVDDGSTDGSADLVAQLVKEQTEPRIRLLRQANSGVSRARNAGIAAAAGDWVAFLDADDLWHPDYLHTLATLIQAQPTVLAVACTYRSVSAEQAQSSDCFHADAYIGDLPVSLIHDLPSRWLQGTCFFTSSVIVKRSILVSLQPCFPPNEHMGEDLDLWFRLGEIGPIALSPVPLVLRLWVPGSLSSGQVTETDPPYILRLEARARSGQTPPTLRRSSLRYVGDSRITLARTLISLGRRAHAWPLLCRAARHASPHRWTVSLLMLLLPGQTVQQFQSWRMRRKMIL